MSLSKTITITRSECSRCGYTKDREGADPDTLPDRWGHLKPVQFYADGGTISDLDDTVLCPPCFEGLGGFLRGVEPEPDTGAQLADLGAQFVQDFAAPEPPAAPAPANTCACAVCGKVTARTQAGTPRKHQRLGSDSKSYCPGCDQPGVEVGAAVAEVVPGAEPGTEPAPYDPAQAIEDYNEIPF